MLVVSCCHFACMEVSGEFAGLPWTCLLARGWFLRVGSRLLATGITDRSAGCLWDSETSSLLGNGNSPETPFGKFNDERRSLTLVLH